MQMSGTGMVGTEDPQVYERAQKQAAEIFEELKAQIQTRTVDAGTLRKELHITVPGSIISGRIEKEFAELSDEAFMPGFRKGRAPRALIQKRYGGNVRESLKTSVVGQSFYAAVEKEKLEVLGEPLFRVQTADTVKLMDINEALPHIELPETGDFAYSCEIELKPSFELPELKGIEVKNPQLSVTDEDVEGAIERQTKIRGKFVKIDAGAAEENDALIADVKLICEGKLVKEEAELQLGVRPTRLDGIALTDLQKVLVGAKAGDQRKVECTIPDDYERADLRGKPATFEFNIHEVRRLEPVTLASLAEQMGMENEDQLRRMVRGDLEAELDRLVDRAKKEQLLDYLHDNTKLELPEKLSARQTDRAVMRRVIEEQQRGVPPTEIEARIDELRTSAKKDVARDLRLEFIMEKVAKQLGIEVAEEEVNNAIANIARQYNQRFDRMRDDLQRKGLLPQLVEGIRQDKCLDQILQDAKFVTVEAPAEKKPAKEKAPKAEKAEKGEAAEKAEKPKKGKKSTE